MSKRERQHHQQQRRQDQRCRSGPAVPPSKRLYIELHDASFSRRCVQRAHFAREQALRTDHQDQITIASSVSTLAIEPVRKNSEIDCVCAMPKAEATVPSRLCGAAEHHHQERVDDVERAAGRARSSRWW